MRLGPWLLVIEGCAIVVLSVLLSICRADRDAARDDATLLRERNAQLAAANLALTSLKATALRMGREPVRISGTMWIVLEEQ